MKKDLSRAVTRRRDIILLASILAVCALAFVICTYLRDAGGTAYVYVDDELVEILDLSVDGSYEYEAVGGSNTVTVSSGAVCVSEADCPDRLCVRMGSKSRDGDTITCLPHKLVVEVHGGQDKGYDVSWIAALIFPL